MAYKPRLTYTSELQSEIWHRYKQGDSLWSIARSIDRSSSSCYGLLSPTGGIQPSERKRSRHALSLAEREEISRGIVANLSIRKIAVQLGRSLQQLAARSVAMVVMLTTEQQKLIRMLGATPSAPKDVNWLLTTL